MSRCILTGLFSSSCDFPCLLLTDVQLNADSEILILGIEEGARTSMPRTERARAVAATSVDVGEGQRNPLASPSLSPLPSVNPTHRHNGRRSESCRPVPTALSPFRPRRRTRSSPCRQHKLTHLLSAQRSNQARLGQALPAALAQGPNRQLSRRLQEAQRRRPPQARPAPGAGPDRRLLLLPRYPQELGRHRRH
jgi:hypothetical protein